MIQGFKKYLPGLVAGSLLAVSTFAAVAADPTPASAKRSHSSKVQESPRGKAHLSGLQHSRRATKSAVAKEAPAKSSRSRVVAVKGKRGAAPKLAVKRTRSRYSERFTASSFADNLTLGDVTTGEDPVVRESLIQALGSMNGTALAIDPANGRILAMVNQKLALSRGAEPCSTIKLSVALAALSEGLIKHDTPVNLGGHYNVDLDYALAKSVNPYFEVLGRRMGFERVKHYANQFGLGELAGYQIEGEQLGIYPDEELPEKLGGVGRMCSFGESISMTPLQLGALVSSIANGGTLYYLQHPTTADGIANFQPKVKRTLDIGPLIPEMLPGMAGAVNARYGTARSLRANFTEFPVLGKTGTCSNNGTRFGWFASYADTPSGRMVTVFFLEGGRPTFGPKAAELTGLFYRAMADKSYFLQKTAPATTPVAADEPKQVAGDGPKQVAGGATGAAQ